MDYFWGYFYTFSFFSNGQGTEWEYFFGLLKLLNIFLGMPDIPDAFFVVEVDAGTYKNESTPWAYKYMYCSVHIKFQRHRFAILPKLTHI